MFRKIQERSFDQRRAISERIMSRYPDRIPAIVDRPPDSLLTPYGRRTIPVIDKNKYLIPRDLTAGAFLREIRKHMIIKPEQAIFLFVNETLLPNAERMNSIYNRHRDPDGFLYITYATENTFGLK